MDFVSITRSLAKLPYTAARRPLEFFDDRVLARFWDEHEVPRSSFGRLVGSADRLAGWLLADDTLAQRGSDRLHQAGSARPEEAAAAETAPETEASPWATAIAEQAPVPAPALVSVPAEPALEEPAELAAPDTGPAVPTVPVTFTLPGEVGAGDVALCGDFSGWTAGSIPLRRGSDGAWQVTVPLAPGSSYRYRYLLDGERWENAWHADRYEPNPFGSDDSVVIVDWPELTLQAA